MCVSVVFYLPHEKKTRQLQQEKIHSVTTGDGQVRLGKVAYTCKETYSDSREDI